MSSQPPPSTVRRLRRGEDRKIAGVCSGIADYFKVDPNIVRLVFIAGLFVGFASALVYVAGWALMPGPTPVVLPASGGPAAPFGPAATQPAPAYFAAPEPVADQVSAQARPAAPSPAPPAPPLRSTGTDDPAA